LIQFHPTLEGHDDDCNIFVDKLPATFDEEEFKQHFAQFGQISRIKLLVDKNTGVSKCNGFILYDNSTSADSAINEMNGKVVEENGNALYVRKAMENKNKKMMQFGWPGILGSPASAIAKVGFIIRLSDGWIFDG
jgi:RNA recognition motif-containing protein